MCSKGNILITNPGIKPDSVFTKITKKNDSHITNSHILPEEKVFKIKLIGLKYIQDLGDLEYVLADKENEYLNQEKQLNALEDKLTENPMPSSEIVAGAVGLVIGPNKNIVRVKIEEVKKRYSTVYILDYHYMDSFLVSNSKIHSLPEKFKLLPRRVRRFELLHLNYHLADPLIINHIKLFILDKDDQENSKVLIAKVEARNTRLISLYRMKDYTMDPTLENPNSEGCKSINEIILKKMLKVRSPCLPQSQFENNNAKILFIEENGTIFLRFEDSVIVQQLILLMEQVSKGSLRRKYKAEVISNSDAIEIETFDDLDLDTSKIYLTTWHGCPNHDLYRAKFIKESAKKDHVKVYFIDWGNADIVHKACLVEAEKVSTLLNFFPPIGIKAHLAGIKSLNYNEFLAKFNCENSYTVRRAINKKRFTEKRAKQFTLGDEIFLFSDHYLFEKEKEQTFSIREFKSFKFININEFCIKREIAVPSHNVKNYLDIPINVDFNLHFDCSKCLFDFYKTSRIWTLGDKDIELKAGFSIDVYVYRIIGFSEVYIQPLQASSKLKELKVKINQFLSQEHIRKCRAEPKFIHHFEEICFLAPLPNTNDYARVQKINRRTWKSQELVDVLFVDYGFTQSISSFQIAPITKQFVDFSPPLGAKGIVRRFGSVDVDQIQGFSKDLREKKLDDFKGIFEKKNCVAEILRVTEDTNKVKILELNLQETPLESVISWYSDYSYNSFFS